MIAARFDLLVIGGLTIDRFADGSSAPGGSVLHIARAVSALGVRLAVLTVAGPEPEARAAVDELSQLAVAVESSDAAATATFRHNDTAQGRRLVLERRGGRVEIARSALVGGADAVLVAPVAGDVATGELSLLTSVPLRAAILQGWLRSLDEGTDVRPLPIQALGAPAISALCQFDLVVASREDLLEESRDPREQLESLRRAVGAGPALVVTDGADGLWLGRQTSTSHLPVLHQVENVPTLGAGDILAALLTIGDPTDTMENRARDAMRIVAEILDERLG